MRQWWFGKIECPTPESQVVEFAIDESTESGPWTTTFEIACGDIRPNCAYVYVEFQNVSDFGDDVRLVDAHHTKITMVSGQRITLNIDLVKADINPEASLRVFYYVVSEANMVSTYIFRRISSFRFDYIKLVRYLECLRFSVFQTAKMYWDQPTKSGKPYADLPIRGFQEKEAEAHE